MLSEYLLVATFFLNFGDNLPFLIELHLCLRTTFFAAISVKSNISKAALEDCIRKLISDTQWWGTSSDKWGLHLLLAPDTKGHMSSIALSLSSKENAETLEVLI